LSHGPVCIFGGAFDPIHIAHLIVAEDVRQTMAFDMVCFVPCSVPPTKDKTEAGVKERMDMVKLAIKGNPHFEVSDIETKRKGKSYSIDTISEMSKVLGRGVPMFLLMGTDQLNLIETWHEPERILKLCTILAMHRPGVTPKQMMNQFAARVKLVSTKQVDISSTEIRRRLHLGLSVRYLVTDSVLDYIYKHGLYGTKTRGQK
jgi:nicotinate-nucleotide adenylyltransferase